MSCNRPYRRLCGSTHFAKSRKVVAAVPVWLLPSIRQLGATAPTSIPGCLLPRGKGLRHDETTQDCRRFRGAGCAGARRIAHRRATGSAGATDRMVGTQRIAAAAVARFDHGLPPPRPLDHHAARPRRMGREGTAIHLVSRGGAQSGPPPRSIRSVVVRIGHGCGRLLSGLALRRRAVRALAGRRAIGVITGRRAVRALTRRRAVRVITGRRALRVITRRLALLSWHRPLGSGGAGHTGPDAERTEREGPGHGGHCQLRCETHLRSSCCRIRSEAVGRCSRPTRESLSVNICPSLAEAMCRL